MNTIGRMVSNNGTDGLVLIDRNNPQTSIFSASKTESVCTCQQYPPHSSHHPRKPCPTPPPAPTHSFPSPCLLSALALQGQAYEKLPCRLWYWKGTAPLLNTWRFLPARWSQAHVLSAPTLGAPLPLCPAELIIPLKPCSELALSRHSIHCPPTKPLKGPVGPQQHLPHR